MKQVLELKLSPQLTLTPQLQQSLKLLQLPSAELEQEIQLALDSNPLLERVDAVPSPAVKQSENNQSSITTNDIPQPIAEAADPSIEMERIDHLAAEQDLAQSFEVQRSDVASNKTDQSPFTSHIVAHQETLADHLHWQIRMTNLSDKDKLIANALIASLDDDGYLCIRPCETLDLFDPKLEIDEAEVNAVLSLIKTLDPVGVGARDLEERLLLLLNQSQVQYENSLSALYDQTIYDLAKTLIKDHLNLLSTHDFSRLKKQLSLTNETLGTAVKLITSLNPRVTSQFSDDKPNHVIPDIIVKRFRDRWVGQLNSDNQAKLRINKLYAQMLSGSNKTKLAENDSDFIQENLNQAKVFIKGLMSRYDTLLLVAQKIIERQQGFFTHGEDQMRAMTLRDIADDLELHESTISRATAGKYLVSPRGVFELKYFFSSALNNADGAVSSSTAIRSLIKKMVDNEPKQKPLSDSKITKELAQQGHNIARRTVAKYRESMQIAPSSQRKLLS